MAEYSARYLVKRSVMLSKHIVPTEFEREGALAIEVHIDQTRAYSKFGPEYPVISWPSEV
jgi:hypothetical protein